MKSKTESESLDLKCFCLPEENCFFFFFEKENCFFFFFFEKERVLTSANIAKTLNQKES